jgi:hypothetical protein
LATTASNAPFVHGAVELADGGGFDTVEGDTVEGDTGEGDTVEGDTVEGDTVETADVTSTTDRVGVAEATGVAIGAFELDSLLPHATETSIRQAKNATRAYRFIPSH